jgi:transposase InsO family protein
VQQASKGSKSSLAIELGISRASLYYHPKIPEKDELLRKQIEEVMRAHPGYGYRRVALALDINHKRAKRVMKKFNLKPARRAKTPKKPNDLGKAHAHYPDMLSKLSPVIPDFVWVSDFTYISFKGTWYYLATVLDAFSGMILGFNISRTHDATFVKRAIQRAVTVVGKLPQWFNSDQGSEYHSDEVSLCLEMQGVSISMSPKSSPWRNGAQESFFGRFKVEFEDPDRFHSLGEFLEAIYTHIHYFAYGRIKNKLKMTPAEFRENWFSTHAHRYPQVMSLPPHPPHAAPSAQGTRLLLFE